MILSLEFSSLKVLVSSNKRYQLSLFLFFFSLIFRLASVMRRDILKMSLQNVFKDTKIDSLVNVKK